MKTLEDYFTEPDKNEIDKQFLRQLCYDGQMDDDEIEEFVEAVIAWKNKAVHKALEEAAEKAKTKEDRYEDGYLRFKFRTVVDKDSILSLKEKY